MVYISRYAFIITVCANKLNGRFFMKRIIRAFLISVLAFTTTVSAFAYDAKSLVGKETYDELKKNTYITTYKYGSNKYNLDLIPNTPLSKKIPAFWDKEKNPVYVIEYLYLLNKKDLVKKAGVSADIEYSSRVLRSISTMKGIQYYSNTDKMWETLYKEAYTIKSATDYTRIDDDVEGSADKKKLYCMLKDKGLGELYYSIEYNQTAEEVSASFNNLEDVCMGWIKCVDKNNLKMNMVITDCGDEVLVYLVGRANFPKIGVLEKKMNKSIGSRVEALFTWYKSQF